ncbi:MAG TPA: HupE/UreJ family protein [Telluria sp.]|nr:HupE/UreJ family protein [Telluria sp.]
MKKVLTMILLLASVPALAHSGHGDGFGAGLAHPFTGIDHVLAMLGIGLWSRRQAQPLSMPLTFIALMALGALVQLPVALPEALLAGTVVAVGVLLAAGRVPHGAALALVGVFALLHGQAHGRELPALASAAGYLIASALLLTAGRALGRPRVAGAIIGVAGLCLLAVPSLA